MITSYIFSAGLIAVAVLSVRSVAVLQRRSPWTSAGWALSALYCIVAAYELLSAESLPHVFPYGTLAAMTAAFVVAGVKDEPQAEPWYLPSKIGKSRAETRSQ